MSKNDQIIYYGAPGTGKSYKVKKYLKENEVNEDNIIRVVFHSDYSYSDFIGYIIPHTIDNGEKLEYKFNPGPFTIALEKALSQDSDNVYLILEEINRGDTASIFGDIFQLLDRNEGQSEFPITNLAIRDYLNTRINEEVFTRLNLGENEIVIPKNLKIICTMNTADQNVFVIDTAFKRRFKMEYVPIDFDNKTDRLIELDEASKNIFGEKHCWSDFAKKINDLIDEENSNGFNISEDKKLGQYFVDKTDLSSKEVFCDKVIYYLKNDVFKYNDKILNDSYEDIHNKIVNGQDIFDII